MSGTLGRALVSPATPRFNTDMSRRVYQVLLDYSPRVEPYFIDEIALDLSSFATEPHLHCGAMRQAVQQIPKGPTVVHVTCERTSSIPSTVTGAASDVASGSPTRRNTDVTLIGLWQHVRA